jgi:hypothetical protein
MHLARQLALPSNESPGCDAQMYTSTGTPARLLSSLSNSCQSLVPNAIRPAGVLVSRADSKISSGTGASSPMCAAVSLASMSLTVARMAVCSGRGYMRYHAQRSSFRGAATTWSCGLFRVRGTDDPHRSQSNDAMILASRSTARVEVDLGLGRERVPRTASNALMERQKPNHGIRGLWREEWQLRQMGPIGWRASK